jgi:Tfp pilus assembly protein PilZ
MTTDDSLLSEVAEIDERRQDERSRIILNLYYDGHDATGVASLRDISLGGLYMNTNEDIAVGSTLHLRIPINEQENVIAKAEVVYVNSGAGVGVKFIALSDNARELLEKKLTG